ncbi:MAG: hypothetical protein ACTHLA_04730 [Asticcacaulis sp.]|uniref:hypothetical protein n=1 Tax=Asticcacaulis sp. TaxID=1872648 RepID=UPI003F7BFE6A
MRKHSGLLAFTGLTFAVLFAGYMLYLRYTASPLILTGAPIANLLLVLAISVGSLLVYAEYRDSRIPAIPPVKDMSAPASETIAPKPKISSRITGFIGLIVLSFLVYLRHANNSQDSTTWLDAYWPIFLPILLAVTLGFWGYDALFGRIINGTHSGRSAFALRTALIAKRTAMLLLAFTAGVLFMGNNMQAAYNNETAQLLIVAIYASLLSTIVIAR